MAAPSKPLARWMASVDFRGTRCLADSVNYRSKDPSLKPDGILVSQIPSWLALANLVTRNRQKPIGITQLANPLVKFPYAIKQTIHAMAG